MRQIRAGGGWQAIRYTLRKGREVGFLRLWRAMRSKNACKTCALGMGGQLGGMTDESSHFPEVCKKSLQAMTADMRGRIPPEFFQQFSIAQLQQLSPRELEAVGRLVEPVMAGPGDSHYRAIGWEEAFEHIAGAMKNVDPLRSFFYSSGRSSNEAGFLLQLLARAYGTNNVSNCSYYCHQASSAGLMDSIGTPTGTVELEDLEKCDLVILIGGNPSSNHPRFMSHLMKVRNRGGKVVVANPLREPGLANFKVPSNVKSMLFGSQIASHYVQPTIGGDIALLAGIAKQLFEIGGVDEDFVQECTFGIQAVREYVAGLDWPEIEAASGVGRTEIERIAEVYGQSKRTIFAWTMGITHHEHGVQNVQWIANLALLRGMVGKEGAGLLPIRGHSNVQGLGTVGVSPFVRGAALDHLEELGIHPPKEPGYDTLSSLEAAHNEDIDFALCLGGNLFGASPDASFMKQALGRIKTLVYMSTTLNTGHAHGLGGTTIIMPVRTRDEESQSTTQESMFNYVRLSDGGPERHAGLKSEVEILTEIAALSLPNDKLDWRGLTSHEKIRKLIARHIPSLPEMESIGRTKREFHIQGRVIRDSVFHTKSGKAELRVHPIPIASPLSANQLRLMTIRSEGQFNTVVYEEEDLYRGQERRDVILMNAADIARMGFETDQCVTVFNSTGKMNGIRVRAYDIPVGCAAMYYPESNALVPRTPDPKSKTPAFKSVVVNVEADVRGLSEPSESSLASSSPSRGTMKAS